MPDPRSAYIAFDRFPSSKGSATHMTQMIRVLREDLSPALLYSLPGTVESEEKELEHRVFNESVGNFLERAERFSKWVWTDLAGRKRLRLVHFRDIWGGLAAIQLPHLRSVFEVNGLPSIELPYRYPSLHRSTLSKLEGLEMKCLRAADRIIVPSRVIAGLLRSKGIGEDRIRVITNGADVPDVPPNVRIMDYILFFGAMQSWQGVTTLLKALHYLEDIPSMKLVICSSQPHKQVREYQKMISRLNLDDRVEWQYQLPKDQLNMLIAQALCTVAPLTECSRNIVQGCSPLKLFESMAMGTPVVASDLQVVRDIIHDGAEGLLVAPDRPAELARALRLLWEDRSKRDIMGRSARIKCLSEFTWEQKRKELSRTYREVLSEPIPMKIFQNELI